MYMKESYKSSKKLIFPILAVILFLQSYSIFANDGKVAIKNDLPNLSYDHELLLEILEAIPMSAQGKKQGILYLEIIWQQEKMIKEYQLKKHSMSFYSAIKLATLEIKNTAKHLFDLTKHYHPVLPTTLRDLILKPIYPLERDIIKRLEMSSEDREALNNKTKRLYAQQSYIARKNSLKDHLAKIKALLTKPGKPGPVCYVSYAWPSPENKEEYWVQPFLSILYNHLTAAGIRMVMDIRDNEPGASIYQFMQKYYEGNHVLLIGTESLLQKHYSPVLHAVKTELNIISRKAEEDPKIYNHSRLCPLLLSGTIRSSFPEIYDKYSTVRDAREGGYIGMLRNLLDWAYRQQLNIVKEDKAAYEKVCRELEKQHLQLLQELDTEKEISIGYHRQSLQNLKEDTQFQAVQAQEVTKHSSAVGAKMIGALMESQGNNPRSLYSEYGEQYQRPSITPDFIERQVLWKKIVTHFNKSDQQILTLSAHGLGGMGKTELTKYYYLYPPRPYTLRAWFNADSKEQLYGQYIELAKANGLLIDNEIPIEEQVKLVKNWLEKQKDCLLVYDNVPGARQLEGLLPEKGKHHILISSRNGVVWPTRQKLDVDVMEQEEAIALICRITDCSKIHPRLPELVNTLGYLPLALAQAGAYIAETQISIADYLDRYKKYQLELMSDETLARNPKHEPVWITFDMNFKALEEACPSALTTLQQASWLHASDMPELLLRTTLKDRDDKPADLLWDAIKRNIGRYSLMRVDSNKHTLSMHRLVQEILQSKQKIVEKKKILKQVTSTIQSIHPDPTDNKTIEDIFMIRLLLPHMETILIHLKRVFNEHEYSVFNLEFNLGQSYAMTGNYIKAKEIYHTALLIKQRRYKSHVIKTRQGIYSGIHPEIANLLNELALTYQGLGQIPEALEYYQQALVMRKNLYSGNHPDIAASLNNIGLIYQTLRKYQQALKCYDEAFKMMKTLYNGNHPHIATIMNNIGLVYRALEKYQEALKYYEKSLKMRKDLFKDNHPDIANSLANIGRIYVFLLQNTKALAYHEQALKMRQDLFKDNHPDVANSLANMVTVYIKSGEYEKALKYCKKTLKMEQALYIDKHPDIAMSLNDMGTIYFKLNQNEKALKYLNRSLEMKKDLYNDNHPDIATSLNTIGQVYQALGQIPKALNYLKEVLAMYQAIYKDNPEHPNIKKVRENIEQL